MFVRHCAIGADEMAANSWQRHGRVLDVRPRWLLKGPRASLPRGAATRRLSGVVPGSAVAMAADFSHDVLVVDPVGTVARLISDLHARLVEARDLG